MAVRYCRNSTLLKQLSSRCFNTCLPRSVNKTGSDKGGTKYGVSSLYVSDEIGQHTSPVQADLDLDRVFSDTFQFHVNLCARKIEDHVNLEKLKTSYERTIELKNSKEVIEKEREVNTARMRALLKDSTASEIKRNEVKMIGKSLKKQLKNITRELWSVEEETMQTGLRLPNFLSKHTPLVKDEIIKQFGEEGNTTSVSESMNSDTLLYKATSPEGCYLIGDLAVLEQALVEFFMNRFEKQKYIPVVAPDIFKSIVVEGCDFDVGDEDTIYKLELKPGVVTAHEGSKAYEYNILEHSHFLTGVTPMCMAAYFTRTVIDPAYFPLKFIYSGRNYFPSGYSGSDLLRQSQSTCVSVFSAGENEKECEDSIQETRNLISNCYQELNIPFRLIQICSPNLKLSQASRLDFQCYIPHLRDYHTVGYVANVGDYFSRRLMMRYGGGGLDKRYHHVGHGTVVNVHSLICALVENSRCSDGSVKVPECLLEHWIGPLPDGGNILR